GERIEDLRQLAKRHRPTIVASYHFATVTDPGRVQDALEACAAIGDVAKVAAPAEDLDSAIQFIDLARAQSKAKRRVVLVGTGIDGMITRALADDVGQEIQYAAWGGPASPGQLTLAAATRLRGREPMVLGLVGHPLGHSLSPAIHEAALGALDVPGIYLPFDCDAESLDSLLEAAERDHVRGFNVTSPHKEAIVEKLDELDGDSRSGARSPGPGIDSPQGRARVRPGLQPADDSAPRGSPAAREAHDVRPRDAPASGRTIVRAVDRAGTADRTDAASRQGGARVK